MMSIGGSIGNVVASIISALTSTAKSNAVRLKTLISALLLIGVKEFLNDIVFDCPQKHFQLYGSLFIFGPAIFLFCLSLLSSTSFWQVVTGCFLITCRQRRLLWIKAKDGFYVASMPPVIWLVYVFVEQDYYVCAKLGPLGSALARANTSSKKIAVNKDFDEVKAHSHFIAWALLLGLVLFSTIFVTVERLCMPIEPRLLGEDAFHEYRADEAVLLFNQRIRPMAKEEAKKLINNLFEKNKILSSQEQVKCGEAYLKKMFPRHAGILNGPYIVDDLANQLGNTGASDAVELKVMLDPASV